MYEKEKLRLKNVSRNVVSNWSMYFVRSLGNSILTSTSHRAQSCTLVYSDATYVARNKTSEQLDHLWLTSKDSNDIVSSLWAHVDQLRRGGTLESLGPRAKRQVQEILGLSEDILNKKFSKQLLTSPHSLECAIGSSLSRLLMNIHFSGYLVNAPEPVNI